MGRACVRMLLLGFLWACTGSHPGGEPGAVDASVDEPGLDAATGPGHSEELERGTSGREPIETRELDEIEIQAFELTSRDAMFVAAPGGSVGFASAGWELVWIERVSLPSQDAPVSQLVVDAADRAYTLWQGERAWLASHDVDGAQRWVEDIDARVALGDGGAAGASFLRVDMRDTPEGPSGVLSLCDDQGGVLESRGLDTDLLSDARTGDTLRVDTIAAQGPDSFVATTRGRSARYARLIRHVAEPIVVTTANVLLAGETSVPALLQPAPGDEIVGAVLQEARPSVGAFVVRLAAGGQVLWRWSGAGSERIRIAAMALDRSGQVYLAGAERPSAGALSPHAREAVCDAADCQRLVVYKLDSAGVLQWGYRHPVRSFGTDLGLDSSGSLIVSAILAGEPPKSLLLRFDP